MHFNVVDWVITPFYFLCGCWVRRWSTFHMDWISRRREYCQRDRLCNCSIRKEFDASRRDQKSDSAMDFDECGIAVKGLTRD
jgi:hypothetical protein